MEMHRPDSSCGCKIASKRTHGRRFAFLIVTAREGEEEEVYRELTQLRNLARCLRDYCETNSHRTVETIVRTRDVNPLFPLRRLLVLSMRLVSDRQSLQKAGKHIFTLAS